MGISEVLDPQKVPPKGTHLRTIIVYDERHQELAESDMMRTRTRPERVAGRACRRLQKVRSKLEIVLKL